MRAIWVLAAALIALASSSSAQEADWLGIRSDLQRMSDQLALVEPLADLAGPPLTADPEHRSFCGLSDEAFIVQLISQPCAAGECAERKASIRQTIESLSAELSGSMAAARAKGELLFVLPTSGFPEGPPAAEEELPFRAAADLWLRNALQPSAAVPDQLDRLLVGMRAWCGLIGRNANAAVALTQRDGFPNDKTPSGRRQAAAIVYIAQHAAMDYEANNKLRLEAEKAFNRAELSPYYMAQLLDVEREAFDQKQVVGHLTSCNGTRAFFDPPLVDISVADEWRAANGMSSTQDYLDRASLRCS